MEPPQEAASGTARRFVWRADVQAQVGVDITHPGKGRKHYHARILYNHKTLYA